MKKTCMDRDDSVGDHGGGTGEFFEGIIEPFPMVGTLSLLNRFSSL